MPSRNMTTATASASTPMMRVGRPTVEPRAPRAAPRIPKPMIRPALNANCGRMRVVNAGSADPVAPTAAACEAEKPRTRPPTIAMQVETPAVSPRARTSSRPPREGFTRPAATSTSPAVRATQASATRTREATATVIQVDALRLIQDAASGSYPAERIADSRLSRGGRAPPATTAVPRRAETSTDSTPGSRSRAAPTRFSQASHVIPPTAMVLRCQLSGALSSPTSTSPVRSHCAPGPLDRLTRHRAQAAPGVLPSSRPAIVPAAGWVDLGTVVGPGFTRTC